jgi:hypothetical protein
VGGVAGRRVAAALTQIRKEAAGRHYNICNFARNVTIRLPFEGVRAKKQ